MGSTWATNNIVRDRVTLSEYIIVINTTASNTYWSYSTLTTEINYLQTEKKLYIVLLYELFSDDIQPDATTSIDCTMGYGSELGLNDIFILCTLHHLTFFTFMEQIV